MGARALPLCRPPSPRVVRAPQGPRDQLSPYRRRCSASELVSLPALFTTTPAAADRTLEFFTANIRNPNTRRA